jgi:hypothetical protein
METAFSQRELQLFPLVIGVAAAIGVGILIAIAPLVDLLVFSLVLIFNFNKILIAAVEHHAQSHCTPCEEF